MTIFTRNYNPELQEQFQTALDSHDYIYAQQILGKMPRILHNALIKEDIDCLTTLEEGYRALASSLEKEIRAYHGRNEAEKSEFDSVQDFDNTAG